MNVSPRGAGAPEDDADMVLDAASEQFVVTFAACLENARLGGFHISVQLDDGRRVEGIPSTSVALSDGAEPFETAKLAGSVELAGTTVRLRDVRRYTVSRPA